jgi:ABC-type antimicrobial peptide transport system permease subunit
VKGNWVRVVGVVKDSKYYSMDDPARPFFYVPLRQNFAIEPDIHIRATQPVQTVQAALLREVRALDPNLALYEMITLQEQVNRSTSHELVAVALVALFGGLPLLLASIGLYGVMSCTVSQSTRELGLRMALGAGASNVLRLVLSRGLLLTTTGIVIGFALALLLTHLLGNLLYQVSPRDPLAFAAAFAVMTLASTAACLLPAWRAARTDYSKRQCATNDSGSC